MEDENSATAKICRGTCSVLEYLISRNASAPRVKSHFHSNSAPPIPIVAYVQRIVKHAYCSDEAFIGALMFLAYHCAVTNHPITTYNVHRIYFTAVVIAIKCRDDHYRSNVYYAQVGGLTRQKSEVGTLETEFLSTIGWDAWMDEQIYMQTYTMVEQLSDLPANPSEDDLDEIAQAVDYWESKLFASFQERRDGLNKRLREDMIAVAANQQRNRSLTGSPTTPNTRGGSSTTSLAAVAGAPSFYPAGQRPGGSGHAASAIPSGAPHSVIQGGSLLRRPNHQYTAEEQQQFGTIGQMSCDSALHNKFAVGEIIRVDKEAPVHYGNNTRGGSVGGTGVAEEDEDANNNSNSGINHMSTPTSNSNNINRRGGTPSEAISCGMYIPRRSNNTVASNGSDTSVTGSPIKVNNTTTTSGFRGASNTTRTYSSSGHASPLANQDRGLSTELYIQRKTKKRMTPVQAETAGDAGPNTPHDGSNSRDPSFTSTPTSTNTAANNMAFPNTAAFVGGGVSTVKVSARDGSVGTEMGGTSSFQGSPTEASNRQFPSVSRSTVAVTEVDSKRSSLQNKQYGAARSGAAEEGGTGTPLTYNDDGRAGSNSTITNRRNNAPAPLTRSFSPDILPQGVPSSANTHTTGYNVLSPNKPPLCGSPSSFGAGSSSGFNTTAPKGGRNRMTTKHRFSSASLCATPDGRNPITSADSSAGAGDRYVLMGATNQRFASYHEYPASHYVDPSKPGGAPGVRLTSMPQSSSHNEHDDTHGGLAPRTEATKGMPERFLQVATGASSRNLNGLRTGGGGSLERGEEEEGEADRFASTSPNVADGWRTSASRNSNSQQPSSGTAGGGGGQRGGAVRGRRAGAANSGQAAEGKKRAKNPAWVQDE